jgi:hypothetical protein
MGNVLGGFVKNLTEHKDMNRLSVEVRNMSDPFGIEVESSLWKKSADDGACRLTEYMDML